MVSSARAPQQQVDIYLLKKIAQHFNPFSMPLTHTQTEPGQAALSTKAKRLKKRLHFPKNWNELLLSKKKQTEENILR